MLNSGDTAWVLASAALVMLMTPGLAFFYGGMVRSKSVLNMLMMNFIALAVVGVLWVLYGFSLAFGNDIGGGLLGGLEFAGLENTVGDLVGYAVAADPEAGVAEVAWPGNNAIPVLAFAMFQLMFAVITPALISGAIADRVKFWSWTLFVGAVGHHRVLPGGALGVLLRRLRRRGRGRRLDRQRHQARRARLRRWHRGAHQRRRGGPRPGHRAGQAARLAARADAPAQPAVRAARRGLLWFGWFGFNAGSALGAGDLAGVAFTNTMVATAAAVLGWLIVEQIRDGKPTTLGAASGAVAGLVAITPACGFVAPLGALAIGADRRCGVRAGRGAEVPVRLRRLARRGRRAPGRRSGRHPADRVLRHHQRQRARRRRPVLRRRRRPAGQAGGRRVRRDGLLVRRHD